MAPSNTTQDDYYAQVQSAQKSGADDKKPLKIKLKPVVKKIEDAINEAPSPLTSSESAPETPVTEVVAPKARLVTREHAGE